MARLQPSECVQFQSLVELVVVICQPSPTCSQSTFAPTQVVLLQHESRKDTETERKPERQKPDTHRFLLIDASYMQPTGHTRDADWKTHIWIRDCQNLASVRGDHFASHIGMIDAPQSV